MTTPANESQSCGPEDKRAVKVAYQDSASTELPVQYNPGASSRPLIVSKDEDETPKEIVHVPPSQDSFQYEYYDETVEYDTGTFAEGIHPGTSTSQHRQGDILQQDDRAIEVCTGELPDPQRLDVEIVNRPQHKDD